ETTKETTATPSPCLAGGQAAALLADRRNAHVAGIEKFSRNFGAGRVRRKSLTGEEFENKRQEQIKALLRASAAASGL
ncbi:MAG: hypothetical protein JW837_05315, partial [Sedimentisphaerales bacterium]|nr:hypothetical protein [Sedimentisphaerales bacterium]